MEQLINRARQFILQPKEAWEEVKDETTTAQNHISSYVLPLSLIPAVATFIGYGLIGYSVFGVRVHSMDWAISQAITSIITTLVGIFISGFVIHKLAANYHTEVSLDKAVKLVGYSYTAMLVAGVFNIFPALAVLGMLAGIYSLYVFYIGFKPMTNVTEEKSMTYFIVSILVIIAVYILLGLIMVPIVVLFGVHSPF